MHREVPVTRWLKIIYNWIHDRRWESHERTIKPTCGQKENQECNKELALRCNAKNTQRRQDKHIIEAAWQELKKHLFECRRGFSSIGGLLNSGNYRTKMSTISLNKRQWKFRHLRQGQRPFHWLSKQILRSQYVHVQTVSQADARLAQVLQWLQLWRHWVRGWSSIASRLWNSRVRSNIQLAIFDIM